MNATAQTTNHPGAALKERVKTLAHSPGIYRMLDQRGEVLYVGKARDLRKRVGSYFNKSGLSPKTRIVMSQTHAIDCVVTESESEALLLENNLIKKHRPRYNVLLRDDKSYPYIQVSGDEFPRISFYRGPRKAPGRYFGPYPSASAVRETLGLLQKLFKLRQCENSFFKNRSRPCLQHQIKRCSAPCVGLIDGADYRAQLALAVELLSGNSRKVIETLIRRMDAASEQLQYEEAVNYRDQIATLRQVSEQQSVSTDGGDSDIIACHIEGHYSCVQVFNVRGGLNIGNKAFYPQLPDGENDVGTVLTAFAGQYYLNHKVPKEIIFNRRPADAASLRAMLSNTAGAGVKLTTVTTGKKRRCLLLAIKNAEAALSARLLSRKGVHQRLQRLQEALDLPRLPRRIECFDVSHTMGEKTVASCVVFDQRGANKHEYRRFNIKGITPGDDYAALRQAVTRRYRRLKRGEAKLPDVLLIDGGKAQTSEVKAVLKELEVNGVEVIGVAKGAARKPGEETLIYGDFGETMKLPPDSTALHLVQQIRDEAHHFAITGHKHRRGKARRRSVLEDIPNVGPKRRRDLLRYFGGTQAIGAAGIAEISKVPGISKRLAEKIYETIHQGIIKQS